MVTARDRTLSFGNFLFGKYLSFACAAAVRDGQCDNALSLSVRYCSVSSSMLVSIGMGPL